jgi:DNA-binding MarR family transcriptional regulator
MALLFFSPLHKATRQLSVHCEAASRGMGVSNAEGHLLSYLRTYAPAPTGQLARIFGLKLSTLTSLLDRLERAALIRRTQNPGDRRSIDVTLTPRGKRLATRLTRMVQQVEANISARVSARELAGFQAVMRAVDEVTGVRLRGGGLPD